MLRESFSNFFMTLAATPSLFKKGRRCIISVAVKIFFGSFTAWNGHCLFRTRGGGNTLIYKEYIYIGYIGLYTDE